MDSGDNARDALLRVHAEANPVCRRVWLIGVVPPAGELALSIVSAERRAEAGADFCRAGSDADTGDGLRQVRPVQLSIDLDHRAGVWKKVTVPRIGASSDRKHEHYGEREKKLSHFATYTPPTT
ncbi:MAG TPA: hypothetical protein VGM45_04520 [Gaiellaceae bacterium]